MKLKSFTIAAAMGIAALLPTTALAATGSLYWSPDGSGTQSASLQNPQSGHCYTLRGNQPPFYATNVTNRTMHYYGSADCPGEVGTLAPNMSGKWQASTRSPRPTQARAHRRRETATVKYRLRPPGTASTRSDGVRRGARPRSTPPRTQLRSPGAPYDRLISTYAVSAVPWAWVEQTRPGGRIVGPWGRLGHVALTVADDGRSATGWMQGLATFMPARGTRPALGWQQVRGTEPVAEERPVARDLRPLRESTYLLAKQEKVTQHSAGDPVARLLGLNRAFPCSRRSRTVIWWRWARTASLSRSLIGGRR